MRNLALNRPALQSSTSVWSRGDTPARDAAGGNNGRITGELGFHTARERNPWWQVELPAICTVRIIQIFNRAHMAERLRFFSLLLSIDGEDWREVFRKTDPAVFGGDADASPFVATFKRPRLARFVRLRLNGFECLHFDEMEVLGEILDPTDTFGAFEDEQAWRDAHLEEIVTGGEGRVIFLQTSDPFAYADMLFCTSRTVRRYCQDHGFAYEAYLGIKRGYHPYQATFNRIYMLEELVSRGFKGWAVYMDADAFIADFSFDLAALLYEHGDKGFMATPSGASDHPWDVNAGVFLLNLSHPTGLAILRRWKAAYEEADDAKLRACSAWNMGLDDQQMLHVILSELPRFDESCVRLPWALINSPDASFIRQHLRAMHDDMPTRLAAIERDVFALMEER